MTEKSLIAVGINCIDEYYTMDGTPNMGDKVNVTHLTSKVGGMIGNAAAVYAGYQQKTYMIDFINNNSRNDILIKDLVDSNVDISLIVRDDDIPDATCLIMLSEGERIIFVVENERKPLYFTEQQVEKLANAEFIYATVMDLKRIHNSLEVINKSRSNGAKLVFDVEANSLKNSDEDMKYISCADILFINESGDKVFIDRFGKDYIGEFLNSAEIVVITKGSRGCSIHTKDLSINVDSLKVVAKDTTGAGDTFNATFLYGLSCGWDLEAVGYFANAAAAKAILSIGPRSGVSSEADVRVFIEKYNDKNQGGNYEKDR